MKNNEQLLSQLIPELLRKQLHKKISTLVDIGSSDGIFLEISEKIGLLQKIGEIHAIDRDPLMLKKLKKKFPQIKTNKINLESKKKASSSIQADLAICAQVIEHIEDQATAMKNIADLIKPKGKLYISSVMKKWYGLYWYRNKKGEIVCHPDHKHEFGSQREFFQLIENAGFKVITLQATPGTISLIDYLFRLKNIFFKKSVRDEHRFIYFQYPQLIKLRNYLTFIRIPGYFHIEALAQKI